MIRSLLSSSKPRTMARLCTATLSGLSMLTLLGCASAVSPPASYMLPSSTLELSAEQQFSAQLAVVVAPVRIANHLDNDGIVMQLNDIELYQAREHLWAESIGQQLQQQLQQRLSKALPNSQIVSKGQPSSSGLAVRELRLQVYRFQGQLNGDALAQGQWQLLDGNGTLLSQHNFSQTAPLADNGYPALVRALGQAWQQEADALAKALASSQR